MIALLIHKSGHGYIKIADIESLTKLWSFDTFNEHIESGEWRYATEEEITEFTVRGSVG